MNDLMYLKGGKTLVNTCTNVKPGEKVLIISERTMMPIAEAIARASNDNGAETVITVMNPRSRAGEEPPEVIAAAMLKADVIFVPVSFSITHTFAVKNAAAGGARVIVMTRFTEEMMISGGIEADFKSIKPVCRKVSDYFTAGKKLRLTSSGGTDLEVDITGRKGNALYCIVEPGEFSTVPTIEANVSPVEGSASGRIVADASIPYLGIGVLEEPVYIDVKEGFITGIKGGRQADILIKDLESHNNKNVYNIAEIGVGLNPCCRMCGIMLEDEGVISTCHIGIGTSITLGGTIKAPVHYDLIMHNPIIEIDGKIILNKDKVL